MRRAVAASLEKLGYAVTLRQNTSLRELLESLREFSVRAAVELGAPALLRGARRPGARARNYLLPVDTDPHERGRDRRRRLPTPAQFIDRLSAIKHGTNIVVLDACRVNPFIGGVIVGPDGRRAEVPRRDAHRPRAARRAGRHAGRLLDRAQRRRARWARRQAQHLREAPADAHRDARPADRAAVQEVRIGVAEETQRVQVPWESSSLTSEFCFKTGNQGRCGA